MTLTDGTTTLTFDSFLEQGPSGGAQVVNGNLVFNIMNSEIAALKTMLEDGTPDGIVITSAFSAGQTQLVAETQLIVHFQFNYRLYRVTSLSKK